MARKSFNALLAALLATAWPGIAGAAGAQSGGRTAFPTARVLDYGTRILAERDPFSAVIVPCLPGDVYPVRRKLGDWYEVELSGGQFGWILARHVVVRSARALPGTGGEVAAALTGSLIGSTVTAGFYGGTLVLLFGPGDLLRGVRGSGAVSGTTVWFALGATAASFVLTPAAAAYGAYTVGEKHSPGGNMLTSWAYAGAGGIAGFGLGYCVDAFLSRAAGGSGGLFAGIGLLVGMTAGAVLGYEESKPPFARQYRWAEHIRPPAVGLASSEATLDCQSLAMKVNVVNVRF
jgi:hypothetical protein